MFLANNTNNLSLENFFLRGSFRTFKAQGPLRVISTLAYVSFATVSNFYWLMQLGVGFRKVSFQFVECQMMVLKQGFPARGAVHHSKGCEKQGFSFYEISLV